MKQEDNVWAQVGHYTGLAFILPVSTFVGYAIGFGLDKLFHTGFLWWVFLTLGAAAGFIELYRELAAEARRDDV